MTREAMRDGPVWIAGGLAVLGGAVLIAAWLMRDPTSGFSVSLPGMDDPFHRKGRVVQAGVKIGSLYRPFDGVPSERAGAWPCFRGVNRDNIAVDPAALADQWPEAGPPVLWTVDLGEGHAGAAVKNGRVYVLDYVEKEGADMLRCFSLDDGREIWQRGYHVKFVRNHGYSRTVPAVTDTHVVTLGPRCHVMCVDARTGDYKWGFGLMERYGSADLADKWYAGQCPLIDGDTVVLAPVGTNVLLTGLDIRTGDVRWVTPMPGKWTLSHASIAIGRIAGRRMYVYPAIGGIAGIAADGPDVGRLLWSTTEWNANVIAPTAVVLEGGRVFCTAGYGAGSLVLEITEREGAFHAEKVRQYAPKEGLACEQHTPIYHDGLLYGILPKESLALRNQFVCADRDGKVLWSSGKANRYGLGPFMMADNKFLILNDDGELTMVRVSKTEFVPLATAKILQGVDSWAPMALAGTRLILRDDRRMACVELGVDMGAGDRRSGEADGGAK
jgi:outer membrane protein assembly factor BamB